MLHELFITHCPNGTLIMNPFTFINFSLMLVYCCQGETGGSDYQHVSHGHIMKVGDQ